MISSYEKLVNTPTKVEIWNGQYSCPLCLKLFGNVGDISKKYKKYIQDVQIVVNC